MARKLIILFFIVMLIIPLKIFTKENINMKCIMNIINKKEINICLGTIEKDTLVYIQRTNNHDSIFVHALIINIQKFYRNNININTTKIILPNISINIDEADFIQNNFIQNDLKDSIILNKNIIITFGINQFYNTIITNDESPNFYIDKEPGKSLYKYLEKKYGKNKSKK